MVTLSAYPVRRDRVSAHDRGRDSRPTGVAGRGSGSPAGSHAARPSRRAGVYRRLHPDGGQATLRLDQSGPAAGRFRDALAL